MKATNLKATHKAPARKLAALPLRPIADDQLATVCGGHIPVGAKDAQRSRGDTTL